MPLTNTNQTKTHDQHERAFEIIESLIRLASGDNETLVSASKIELEELTKLEKQSSSHMKLFRPLVLSDEPVSFTFDSISEINIEPKIIDYRKIYQTSYPELASFAYMSYHELEDITDIMRNLESEIQEKIFTEWRTIFQQYYNHRHDFNIFRDAPLTTQIFQINTINSSGYNIIIERLILTYTSHLKNLNQITSERKTHND